MNVIKKYWENVYIYVLLVIPCACMCAAIYYTLRKLQGGFPDTPMTGIFFFDASQIIYFGISLFIVFKNSCDASFIPRHLFLLKSYITLVLFIQYNFILHLFPTDYVWICTYIFLGLVMLFFDVKMLLIHIAGYSLFLFFAHLHYPGLIFPSNTLMYDEELFYHFIIISLTVICFLFITYFVQHFLLQAQIDEEENQFLLEKQLEYYQHTDLMDKELRNFRHDIKNHFIAMEHLLSHNQFDECLTYFQDLEETFSFQEKLYFSGNLIVDSILNYNLMHNCNPQVKITVYGCLPKLNTVSSTDLCTLFSNVLSNAITAVNACKMSEPELSVSFKSGKHHFSITVTNHFTQGSSQPTGFFKKADRNHGFGIGKINELIYKYQGNFEQTYHENFVVTTIYLPL